MLPNDQFTVFVRQRLSFRGWGDCYVICGLRVVDDGNGNTFDSFETVCSVLFAFKVAFILLTAGGEVTPGFCLSTVEDVMFVNNGLVLN